MSTISVTGPVCQLFSRGHSHQAIVSLAISAYHVYHLSYRSCVSAFLTRRFSSSCCLPCYLGLSRLPSQLPVLCVSFSLADILITLLSPLLSRLITSTISVTGPVCQLFSHGDSHQIIVSLAISAYHVYHLSYRSCVSAFLARRFSSNHCLPCYLGLSCQPSQLPVLCVSFSHTEILIKSLPPLLSRLIMSTISVTGPVCQLFSHGDSHQIIVFLAPKLE
ncbi:hypothetical protein PoB_000408000 [Plakobranchus ocellatus]|uniref:Uncharacterized protein n=1 Tax=Plakobranchus ocellatus TaxID=259542 RepID=A0AAV3Y4F0_9GAST|nr:hypothetical protein PoB_000408000 [Plakobranchus ocellatus]